MAQELHTLTTILELPDPLLTSGGYHATSLESLALLCVHLRSPDTQWALVNKYTCSQSTISEIISETATFINKHWDSLLDWDAGGLVHPQRLQEYADALQEFGAPCNTVISFIDCTIQPTCYLGVYQDLMYTGYKKCHSMKYQAVVVPNGLIAHLSGPSTPLRTIVESSTRATFFPILNLMQSSLDHSRMTHQSTATFKCTVTWHMVCSL